MVKIDLFYKGSLFLSKSKVKKIVAASFANYLNIALGKVRTSWILGFLGSADMVILVLKVWRPSFRGWLTLILLDEKFSDVLDVVFLKVEFLAVHVTPYLFSHIGVGLRGGSGRATKWCFLKILGGGKCLGLFSF